MSQAFVSFQGVSVRFRDRSGVEREALSAVTFEVASGEVVCLFGPSGCGKTTLINLVAGFERPTAGRVLVGGREVVGADRGRICMFQNFALYPWRTVRGNVEFGLEVQGMDRRERRRVAGEYLRMVGLESFADHLPHQLSGGMQQRTALARALAVDPETLLMDEPFGSLDVMIRMRLQEEIARIALERRKTVLFVTHDVDEAVFLADRVVVMSQSPGQVRRIIPVGLSRPRERTSGKFLTVRAEVFGELERMHEENGGEAVA